MFTRNTKLLHNLIFQNRKQCFSIFSHHHRWNSSRSSDLVSLTAKFKSNSSDFKSPSAIVLFAAPPFVAFFKKKETEEEEIETFMQKLVPKTIRLIFKSNEKQEDVESPEGQLIITLKRAILCIQRNQIKTAEQMLHLALRMAQDIQHHDGITMCYDIMANLALENGQYEKANKLFVAVLQRLLAKEVKQDDIRVLHISMKLAQIAEYVSEFEKAETGYRFVLDNLEKKMKHDSKDEDLEKLYGLSSDFYGRYLSHKGDFINAKKYLLSSYNIYTKLHGKADAEVVDMLNNLAVVCTNLEEFNEAEKYINLAIAFARNYPELYESGIYHANQGLLYLRRGLEAQARKACSYALQRAEGSKHPEGVEQAKYCLEQIKLATS